MTFLLNKIGIRERRQGAQRHRLERRAYMIGTDLCRRPSKLAAQDLRHGQTTHTPLAWPHAAPTEEFGLVGPLASQSRHFPDPTRRHFLASTDDGFIDWIGQPLWRTIQGVQEGTDLHLLR